MARYAREIVREVLAANDIVDVLQGYLDLKPSGSRRWKAHSPFKNERTPSFMVSQDRQTYHCFSTDQGGDALSFLMAVEGLSFNEALRKLADRAGIRLPVASMADEKAETLRTQLIAFGEFASAHYRKTLLDPLRGSIGRKYIEGRALREATVSRFGLGYVPDNAAHLLEAARAHGFGNDVIEGSGLFKRSDRGGGWYDFFRNRVMFPIKDVSGNIVAFGGRDLGDSPAKYINSPETRLYKKSRTLYGLHEARDAIRKTGFVVLVEGYFDLLRCFDAGVENVVATCGTALTEEQAALIRRYAPEVVLVYDGDAAGIRAALKGTKVLVAAGLSVRAAALPGGQDPDDFVRAQGADAFREVLASAKDFASFYVAQSAERTTGIEGRTAVAHELFEIVRGIDDEMRREGYLKQTAQALGLSEWACRSEYDKVGRGDVRNRAPQPDADAPREPLRRDDVDFLAALIHFDTLRQQAERGLDEVPLPPGVLCQVLESLFGCDGLPEVHDFEDDEARRLWCAAATLEPRDAETAQEVVRRQVVSLRRESLELQHAHMQEALRSAAQDDPQTQTEMLMELVRIAKTIEQLDPI